MMGTCMYGSILLFWLWKSLCSHRKYCWKRGLFLIFVPEKRQRQRTANRPCGDNFGENKQMFFLEVLIPTPIVKSMFNKNQLFKRARLMCVSDFLVNTPILDIDSYCGNGPLLSVAKIPDSPGWSNTLFFTMSAMSNECLLE